MAGRRLCFPAIFSLQNTLNTLDTVLNPRIKNIFSVGPAVSCNPSLFPFGEYFEYFEYWFRFKNTSILEYQYCDANVFAVFLNLRFCVLVLQNTLNTLNTVRNPRIKNTSLQGRPLAVILHWSCLENTLNTLNTVSDP